MAATGFDAEFTETVDMKSNAPAPVKQQVAQPKVNHLAASSRALLSGLGNDDIDAMMGTMGSGQPPRTDLPKDDLFDASII